MWDVNVFIAHHLMILNTCIVARYPLKGRRGLIVVVLRHDDEGIFALGYIIHRHFFDDRLTPGRGALALLFVVCKVKVHVSLLCTDHVRLSIALCAEDVVLAHKALARGDLLIALQTVPLLMVVVGAKSARVVLLCCNAELLNCHIFENIEMSLLAESQTRLPLPLVELAAGNERPPVLLQDDCSALSYLSLPLGERASQEGVFLLG